MERGRAEGRAGHCSREKAGHSWELRAPPLVPGCSFSAPLTSPSALEMLETLPPGFTLAISSTQLLLPLLFTCLILTTSRPSTHFQRGLPTHHVPIPVARGSSYWVACQLLLTCLVYHLTEYICLYVSPLHSLVHPQIQSGFIC